MPDFSQDIVYIANIDFDEDTIPFIATSLLCVLAFVLVGANPQT